MRVIDQRKLVEMNAPEIEQERTSDGELEVKIFDRT